MDSGLMHYKASREYTSRQLPLPVLIVGATFLSVSGCSQPGPEDYFSGESERALASAAAKGDVTTIDQLVSKGVNVNTIGKKGMTPLLVAMIGKSKSSFKRLLHHGADPNKQDDDGDSPMSLAASVDDDSEWLQLALKHGGNPNLVDSIEVFEDIKNRTPLFGAIKSRNLRNVRILVEAGAGLDHQDQSGVTPVMFAASRRWYACVLFLLESGADWRKKNKYGQDLAFDCFSYKVDPSFPLCTF